MVLAVGCATVTACSSSSPSPVSGSDSTAPQPERVEQVPEPNPLELFPRRAGAKAWDTEAELGEVVEFENRATVALASARRTGPLEPRTRAERPKHQVRDTTRPPARASSDATAFVTRRDHDRHDGIRVVVELDLTDAWLIDPERSTSVGSTSPASSTDSPVSVPIELFTEIWPLECQLTVVADGSIVEPFTYRVATPVRSKAEFTFTFAVGSTAQPFMLECYIPSLTALFADGGYHRIVWRIDA